MTHKKEICYWAEHENGTRVFSRSAVTPEVWSVQHGPLWKPDRIYIVDDEWTKLRMAQVDGETIQYNTAHGWLAVDEDWWCSNFYEIYRMHNINDYRVKPKEWYENIQEQGVLCWVWDMPEQRPTVRFIVQYNPEESYPFQPEGETMGFKHAKPLTLEEVKGFIYGA